MRMVNRLVDPTAGRILVNDEDVTHVDPVVLRRHIGYVIQQVGLFPHMTIAQNVAAVPNLLGCGIARRITRAPRKSSCIWCGLRSIADAGALFIQVNSPAVSASRVGVARALAADPPVLLMDEPFGALDPIARTLLQAEFRQILKRVRKTVVLVTPISMRPPAWATASPS